MHTQRAITEQELLENLGWVKTLSARLVGRVDSEDLAQQVCVAVLSQGSIAQPATRAGAPPRIRAWLARTTANLANTHRRTMYRRGARERSAARSEAQPSALDVVARNTLLIEVAKGVDALAEPYRTTVLLRYIESRSTGEIAIQANVTEAVVRKRLSRGLAKLRQLLGEQGVDHSALCGFLMIPTAASTPFVSVPTASVSAVTTTTAPLGTTLMATTFTKLAAGVATAVVATTVLITGMGEAPSPPSAAGSSSAPSATHTVDPNLTSRRKANRTTRTLDQTEAARRQVVIPTPAATQQQDDAKPRKDLDTKDRASQLMAELDLLAKEEYKLARANQRVDGYHEETYADGSRKAAGMIVNGQRNNEWTEWHENGTKSSTGAYFAGKRHGPWVSWDDAGNQTQRGEFLYGRHEGRWEKLEDGVRTVSECRNGAKHGHSTQTGADNVLVREEDWFLDRRHGFSSGYHPNGALASQGNYSHGQKTGAWHYWHANGEPSSAGTGVVDLHDGQTPLQQRQEAVKAELEAALKKMRGR